MEVTDRTEADRKGGHLARRAATAACCARPPRRPTRTSTPSRTSRRHRYFNTNNLWVDLQALKTLLAERDGVLGLPLIVNRKTVDPGDKSSPAVVQLETAMGAAIGVFDGARRCASRARASSPVKTTDDLLALRSDAYVLTRRRPRRARRRRDGTPAGGRPRRRHFKLLARLRRALPGRRAVARGGASASRSRAT